MKVTDINFGISMPYTLHIHIIGGIDSVSLAREIAANNVRNRMLGTPVLISSLDPDVVVSTVHLLGYPRIDDELLALWEWKFASGPAVA